MVVLWWLLLQSRLQCAAPNTDLSFFPIHSHCFPFTWILGPLQLFRLFLSYSFIQHNQTKQKQKENHTSPHSCQTKQNKPLIAHSYPFPESMPTSSCDQIHTTFDLFPSTFHTHHHNKTTFLMLGWIPLLFSHPTIRSLKVGDTPPFSSPIQLLSNHSPYQLKNKISIFFSFLFFNL